MNAKDIVRSGYDRLSTAYRQHFTSLHDQRYDSWLAVFSTHLSHGDKVLELGCADGTPLAVSLANVFDYTGIDLSAVQIANAKRTVPNGRFSVGDMTLLRFPAQSFSGIVALYSIIHVPLDEQRPLIARMFDWLKDGGVLMVVVGAGRWTGTDSNWIKPGTTMYWSHASGDDYAEWFSHAGFLLLERYFVPEGNAGHTFMILKKSDKSPPLAARIEGD